MSYQCQDCTYTGKQFIGGACPGCGSMNIKRVATAADTEQPKARKSYRMTLAWALWGYLLYKALQLAGLL